MRTILFSIVMLLAVAANAQTDKYAQAMQANIAKIDSAVNAEELQALSNTFERIAKAEKNKWQPYYYATLTQILSTYRYKQDEKDKVDATLNKADDLLASAELLAPNNSELLCLKSMIATGRMTVDPQSRYQQYGPQSATAIEQAKKADPTNPRPYLLEAQSKFYTPAFLGGGKDAAKPSAQKSVELFSSYKPNDAFAPNWGKPMAEALLKQCE